MVGALRRAGRGSAGRRQGKRKSPDGESPYFSFTACSALQGRDSAERLGLPLPLFPEAEPFGDKAKVSKYVPCLRMDAALWDIVLHRKEKFLKEIVISRRPCRKTTFFSFVARHRSCMLLLVEFQRRKIIFRARREKGFSCIYPRKRKISLLRASRFGWRSARLCPRPPRSRRKRQLKLSRQPRFLRRFSDPRLKPWDCG